MRLFSRFQIRSEGLSKRCDICHQADQFDPLTGVCGRCQNIARFPITETLRTAIRFRFLSIGFLLLMAGVTGMGLLGLLFLSHGWIWVGILGFLGIWAMGFFSLNQSNRQRNNKSAGEKSQELKTGPTSITLADMVPWVATYRKPFQSVTHVFLAFAMMGILLTLISSYWKKGSYPTSQDTPVFAQQEHYYFKDHGRQIETNRFDYILDGVLIFGSWHCFTMAFALMMIQKLAYEKPLGKLEEGKPGNPYSKASP